MRRSNLLCVLGIMAVLVIVIMLSGCSLLKDTVGLDGLNNMNLEDLAGLELDKLPMEEIMTLLGVAYGIDKTQAAAAMEMAAGVGVVPGSKVDIAGNRKPFQPIPLLPAYPVFIPGDCIHGGAIVEVTNIPIMTLENRDQYNKTLLFALESENGQNIVAVYHRWADNGGQSNWFSAWKLESGHCACIEETHVYQAQHLPGDSAIFEIAWNRNVVRVRLRGSDEQILTTLNVNAFADITADVDCYNELHGPAISILKTWTCETAGNPGNCW